MTRILKKEIVFTTSWFEIEAKTVDEQAKPYYALISLDYVTILAVTEENEILLVKQYRPVLEEETLELPSGHVEREQTPEEAARTELLEETGYRAERMELLGVLNPDPGRLANKLWCFFAEKVSKDSCSNGEDGIEVIKCHADLLYTMMVEGKLNHAMNMAVLFMVHWKNRYRWVP